MFIFIGKEMCIKEWQKNLPSADWFRPKPIRSQTPGVFFRVSSWGAGFQGFTPCSLANWTYQYDLQGRSNPNNSPLSSMKTVNSYQIWGFCFRSFTMRALSLFFSLLFRSFIHSLYSRMIIMAMLGLRLNYGSVSYLQDNFVQLLISVLPKRKWVWHSSTGG